MSKSPIFPTNAFGLRPMPSSSAPARRFGKTSRMIIRCAESIRLKPTLFRPPPIFSAAHQPRRHRILLNMANDLANSSGPRTQSRGRALSLFPRVPMRLSQIGHQTSDVWVRVDRIRAAAGIQIRVYRQFTSNCRQIDSRSGPKLSKTILLDAR